MRWVDHVRVSTQQWIGVDGCRGGWFAVAVDAAGTVRHARFTRFAELVTAFDGDALIGVDIPIGLPSRHTTFRACDRAARRLLGKGLTPRVFSPPTRPALHAPTFAGACAAHRAEVGKAISLQSFHIAPKIREVDTLLRDKPVIAARVLEFHPELVFMRINKGSPVRSSKKSGAGRAERLEHIRGLSSAVARACADAFARYPGYWVARDDVLDAAAIAVALTHGEPVHTTVAPPAPRDEAGLPMQIQY